MIITKKMLIEKGADCEGVQEFERFFPHGLDLSLWTRDFQIRIIKKTRLRKHITWAYCNDIIPLWSMNRADLSSANLSSADLYSANLYRADLSSADLYSANLYSADLSRANLSSANLYSADLSRANLSSANLYSATVNESQLKYLSEGQKRQAIVL
jgi:uncharacterized protein YjbI with pentapeptide repeats